MSTQFQEVILAAMAEDGVTEEELARRMGVSAGSLYYALHAPDVMRLATAVLIARALGHDVESWLAKKEPGGAA